IEKKERLIKLLQEKRSALITHAVTKGLDPTVPMKDSGVEWIGEMPAHWNVMALKYATATRKGAVKTGPFGSQLLSSEMISGEIKVYNQRNVIDHDFRSGENYVTKKKFHELKEFSIFPDDVLITTRGTISQCAIFPLDAEMGILHPCLIRVQPNPQSMIPKYLALVIQDSEIVKLQLLLMSNATTIDVIYSDSLKNVKLPLPPVHEQEAIIDYIQSINKKIGMLVTKTKESITFFKEYRTALISAAVTGKIDVREEVL
ncbi:MAG: restriction endonuclease subunit S, partial [Syntrophales bacterium]|nr:restriction endonuclease subunit S [Syntrophales bacterium]